jgi:RNA polymerase sigma-70 factor, ECF subfamily
MDDSPNIGHRISSRQIVQENQKALDQQSDDVLIQLFQNGNKEVYRYLVERYRERIRNLLFSMFNDPDVVDDLAQEVFIKTYEALHRFRFEASFYTWLYRIAVNKSRDELRKRKVRKYFSLHQALETPDKELIEKTSVSPGDNSAHELIAFGLQRLPEKFRLPVVLKDIDGLSYEEMAEVMECQIGTVKSRLSRGRSMLRNILKPFMQK